MPVGIEAWVTQIPPITRGWLVLAVLTSFGRGEQINAADLLVHLMVWRVISQCHIVTPLQLYFSFNTAFIKVQVQTLPVLVE